MTQDQDRSHQNGKRKRVTVSHQNGKRKRVTVDESGIKLAAEAINDLAKGLASLRAVAKDKLIVLLLNDATGLPKRDIQTILDAIPELERTYMVKR